MDFEVGDVLRVAGLDLMREAGVTAEDAREWIYGAPGSGDGGKIRFRNEWREDADWTVVQAKLADELDFDTMIHLQGRHMLVTFEAV